MRSCQAPGEAASEKFSGAASLGVAAIPHEAAATTGSSVRTKRAGQWFARGYRTKQEVGSSLRNKPA